MDKDEYISQLTTLLILATLGLVLLTGFEFAEKFVETKPAPPSSEKGGG